jgi:hypothetical protein
MAASSFSFSSRRPAPPFAPAPYLRPSRARRGSCTRSPSRGPTPPKAHRPHARGRLAGARGLARQCAPGRARSPGQARAPGRAGDAAPAAAPHEQGSAAHRALARLRIGRARDAQGARGSATRRRPGLGWAFRVVAAAEPGSDSSGDCGGVALCFSQPTRAGRAGRRLRAPAAGALRAGAAGWKTQVRRAPVAHRLAVEPFAGAARGATAALPRAATRTPQPPDGSRPDKAWSGAAKSGPIRHPGLALRFSPIRTASPATDRRALPGPGLLALLRPSPVRRASTVFTAARTGALRGDALLAFSSSGRAAARAAILLGGPARWRPAETQATATTSAAEAADHGYDEAKDERCARQPHEAHPPAPPPPPARQAVDSEEVSFSVSRNRIHAQDACAADPAPDRSICAAAQPSRARPAAHPSPPSPLASLSPSSPPRKSRLTTRRDATGAPSTVLPVPTFLYIPPLRWLCPYPRSCVTPSVMSRGRHFMCLGVNRCGERFLFEAVSACWESCQLT